MLTEPIESRTYLDMSWDPRPLSQTDFKPDTPTGKIPGPNLITQSIRPFAISATNNSVSTETQNQSGQVFFFFFFYKSIFIVLRTSLCYTLEMEALLRSGQIVVWSGWGVVWWFTKQLHK
jgi:hypothetical protein